MKLLVNCFSLLSVVHVTCLFLCHTTCVANQSDDIASGSGELPIEPSTIDPATTDPSTIDPTVTGPSIVDPDSSGIIESTSATHNLLVPFSTDIDAPPPSASVYVASPLSLSSSLPNDLDLLPTSVFGLRPTPTATPSSSTGFSLSPSPSPLTLVSYIINLSRTVVIGQMQVAAVLQSIAESLASQLALDKRDIHNVNLLISSERRKRQVSEEQLVSFSAVEFSVSEEHVSLVELLISKVRGGNPVHVQVLPNETVQVEEIVRSSTGSQPESGASLSSGQLAGIVVGGLTGLVLVILLVASVAVIVVKTRRSSESQEIANLRHTYGYQYTSHSTSEWPPRSPLL